MQHGLVEGPVAGEEEAGFRGEADGGVGWGARGRGDGVVGAREGNLGCGERIETANFVAEDGGDACLTACVGG